jgi:tRNA pseudouridine55 synthase
MSELRRTAIGDFRVERACRPAQLTPDSIPQFLLPASQAVAGLPSVTLGSGEIRRIATGLSIENRWKVPGREIAALDESGCLLAILTPRTPRQLRPLRNFPRPPAK